MIIEDIKAFLPESIYEELVNEPTEFATLESATIITMNRYCNTEILTDYKPEFSAIIAKLCNQRFSISEEISKKIELNYTQAIENLIEIGEKQKYSNFITSQVIGA